MKTDRPYPGNIESGSGETEGGGSHDYGLPGREADVSLPEVIRQLELLVTQQAENDMLIAVLNGELADKDRQLELLQAQLQSLQYLAVSEADSDERTVIERQSREIARLQNQVSELQASLNATSEHEVSIAAAGSQAGALPGHAPADGKALFQARLKKLGTLDLLTGMVNRQHFMQLLAQSVDAADGNGEQALLYILLDNFRAIRENFGVADSDGVLQDVACIIEEMIGARDRAARFGDYVFTVLHHGDGILTTREFAEGILHSLESYVWDSGGHAMGVLASIGICEASNSTLNAEGLVQRADLACEVARSHEGGKIHFHNVIVEQQLDPDQGAATRDMVRKTIRDARFYLVYQPVVSLGGDTRERYEVLLRVLDESGEFVLPSQFLTAAVSMDLGAEVDRWVIDNALGQLSELQRRGRDVIFYIKVSADTMADAESVIWLGKRLAEYRLQRERIVFEIAETAVVDDVQGAIAFVTALQNLECRVALEHYGCCSEPQLLKRLPVDILKVNGGLITGLMANHENQARVRAIIELARKLRMHCVAEHVEETSDLALLWQLGIQFVQGNCIQIPSRELNYNFEGNITAKEPVYMSELSARVG